MDPLALLTRTDKWFLGGGKGAIWAPPFPRYLQSVGFWDESYLADIRLQRLFTCLFLDQAGCPVRLTTRVLDWRPDRLRLEHAGPGVVIQETRCVLECHAWVSQITLESAPGPLDMIVWSLQDLRPSAYGAPWSSLVEASVTPASIDFRFDTAWPAELEPDRTAIEEERLSSADAAMLPPLPVYMRIGSDLDRASHTVNLAQRHDDSPLWETSVLPEKFDGVLPGDFKLRVGPGEPDGLVHLVQHYRLSSGDQAQVFACAGLSPAPADASFEFCRTVRCVDESERAWRRYFAGVPQFSSSDPWLTNAYWYRWYGLRLNTVDMPDLPISRGSAFQAESDSAFQAEEQGRAALEPPDHGLEGHTLGLEGRATDYFSPFVTEGVGFFRNFVTYSAQAHLREVAWMHDPRLAVGILENLGKCQRADGSFPGHNYSCRPARDFYHADFGTGISLLEGIHGRRVTPQTVWPTLERYVDYMFRERSFVFEGEHKPTLFLVFDQNETGQEYMSRYTEVAADADQWSSFRVCGIDATVYVLHTTLMLKTNWFFLGETKPPARIGWSQHSISDGLKRAWNEDEAIFCDVLMNGTLSTARPATGLYPLLAREAEFLWHNDGLELHRTLEEWIANPEKFNLPMGFPADAATDPTFSPNAEWKDKRLNCPWNGRSWPMVNSHIVDAAANFARIFTREVKGNDKWNEMRDRLTYQASRALMKAIKLMFHDGDPSRPNSYEHYNPITGRPALYRGYDDYMHSWIVDLILRHAVGVQPWQDELDPLPVDVDWIQCTDIPHPKGRRHVRIENGNVVRNEILTN